MNFFHLEHSRSRPQGTSHDSWGSSGLSGAAVQAQGQSARRSSRRGTPPPRRLPQGQRDASTDVQHSRGRSTSTTSASWSDDEPMFHMELTPPPSPAPAPPRSQLAARVAVFSNPAALHRSAAETLGRPFKLHTHGTSCMLIPSDHRTQAHTHPEGLIEITEDFGLYHLGSRKHRRPLPHPLDQLNLEFRGAASLALLLLYASGRISEDASQEDIRNQVGDFIAHLQTA